MFPLIPAILLLLLQGHVPGERQRGLALLEAVPWSAGSYRMEFAKPEALKERAAQVCALLRWLAPEDPGVSGPAEFASEPILCPRELAHPLSDGYGKCRRSRDGPPTQV